MAIKYADFLLEIGCEELPPKSLRQLSSTLKQQITAKLVEHRLEFSDIYSFATPRRIAVLIVNLQTKQIDRNFEKKGPSTLATQKAVSGFASSCNVLIENLTIKRIQNNNYYIFSRKQKGEKTIALLTEIIPHILANLRFDNMMRWGIGQHSFIRPVHSLVAILGFDIVPIEIFGIKSSNISFGLRFSLENKNKINNKFKISRANAYEETLRKMHIIADFDKRLACIKKEINILAERENFEVVIDKKVLEEVCALVEYPCIFMGRFDENFLCIPSEILMLTMQTHQKYFPVTKNKKIVARFIMVANKYNPPEPEVIISGNERVLRSRLTDAKFFFEQDKKISLKTCREKLKAVLFIASLGTLYDKTVRLEKLVLKLGEMLGEKSQINHLKRAAQLSKADLVSNVVVEFPELQGVMGGYYAKNDAEEDSVAQAISEHYLPRFAKDKLPTSKIGALLGIADKIDNITGIFYLGKIPTGSKDPYALRRTALGVVRIIIDNHFDFNLQEVIKHSLSLHCKGIKFESLVFDIEQFIIGRWVEYYVKQGVSANVSEAILRAKRELKIKEFSIYDFARRLQALHFFSQQKEYKNLILLNKRIFNILRDSVFTKNSITSNQPIIKTDKSTEEFIQNLNATLLTEKIEKKLLSKIEQLEREFKTDKFNYQVKIEKLCELSLMVNEFFEKILVLVEDENLKKSRLALLAKLRLLFLSIADFSYF